MRHLLTVITLLLALTCCTTPGERKRMYAGLDSLSQRNRNSQPFTPADVQPYVDFFDRHGTANDRLLAYYLMGRAYHEQGEAPMALQYYQIAADCADTTATDCDYAQLSRVYGQMGNIYYQQNLPRQQIIMVNEAVKHSQTAGDTLTAIIYYEQLCGVYESLQMYDSALIVIDSAANWYHQYGFTREEAIARGRASAVLVITQQTEKAKRYIEIYERCSGLFDSLGNIAKGREVYYGTRGQLHLLCNQLDSAEYYFRKELREGDDFNCQNSGATGLALLYNRKHQPDSVAKYALYAYAMNDSLYAQMATQTIEQKQAMYDYSRYQEEAYEKEKKAAQRIVIIWICVGIIITISLLTLIVIREMSRKQKEAEQKYQQSQTLIEQAQQEILKLRFSEESNRELISEKELTIQEQETILKALLKDDSNSQSVANRELKTTDIYKRFDQFSIVGHQPAPEDWLLLKEELFHYYPGFKEFMALHEYQLVDKEYKTCLLIRADFKPKNIAHMLGVTPSYISDIRTEMLQKLFFLSGKSKAFDKMIKSIY